MNLYPFLAKYLKVTGDEDSMLKQLISICLQDFSHSGSVLAEMNRSFIKFFII